MDIPKIAIFKHNFETNYKAQFLILLLFCNFAKRKQKKYMVICCQDAVGGLRNRIKYEGRTSKYEVAPTDIDFFCQMSLL